MKRYVLSMMLATMFMPAFAAAQEEGPEDIEFQMEMRQREMELQKRETQMDIERRMQELELEKYKIDLEREKPKDIDIQMEMRKREWTCKIKKTKWMLSGECRSLSWRNARLSWSICEDRKSIQFVWRTTMMICIHYFCWFWSSISLCAVWVYQDIRRRASGSGIWIVIALLTGLLGTLVYAVVRLGENQKSQA